MARNSKPRREQPDAAPPLVSEDEEERTRIRKAAVDDDDLFAGIIDDEDEDEDEDESEDDTPADDAEEEAYDPDPEPVPKPRGRVGPASDRKLVVPARRHVDMDRRKLTKKQEGAVDLNGWKGKRRGKALDLFFNGQTFEARKKFGHQAVFVGKETDQLVVGIPTPALAFEFLIAQDVFPLGLVLQLVAITGIGKSALVAEFGRWFDLVGGGMCLAENETKFNPNWYRSIMGREAFNRLPIHRCDSVEGWQEALTFALNDTKSRMMGTREAPGPGRTFPVLFAIDSIMGKPSRETTEKIFGQKIGRKKKGGKMAAKKKEDDKKEDDKDTAGWFGGDRGSTGDGSAGRGYPIEAQVITRYMRAVPGELDNWPFGLVLVNHLRLGKDEQGNEARTKSGGVQIDFQESFEIELSKVGGPKKLLSCADWEGYPVSLKCFKNSFGPGHRYIQSRILWWEEEGDGGWEQRTVWDWDWSTIWLLNYIQSGERASTRLRSTLKEADFHLDCTSTAEIENRAWSRSLGMAKSDAAPWTEVGAMIRRDAELTDRLRTALRINRRPLLKGDYLNQLNGSAARLR